MTAKFLSKYKHKTVFKSFWVLDKEGIARRLQELEDVKNYRVDTWQVLSGANAGYRVIVELYTWVKIKKKK